MQFLAGLIAIGLGALACFAGYRIFLLLLPIWAFAVGMVLGANFVITLFGGGFLRDVLGILAGIALGIAFAAVAYFWWAIGVAIALGGAGFALGYSILPALGLDPGFLSMLLGLLVAAVFAVGAIILRLPRVLVVLVTAAWGAGAILAGLLVILGRIPTEQLGKGGLDAVLAESPFWVLIWIALAAAGVVAQWVAFDEFELTPPAPQSAVSQPPDPRLPGSY